MNNNTKKRVHIDYAMRKIIQRRWNVNLDGKHESIAQIAKSLAFRSSILCTICARL